MKQVLSRLMMTTIVIIIIGSTTQAGDKPKIDEIALDHLTQMGEYLAASDEFNFKAEVTTDEVNIGIYKIHTTDHVEAVLRRPDRLWLEQRGDLYNKRFWYNGKSASLLSYAEDMYATTKTASSIDKMLDEMMDKFGVTFPVVDFLVTDPHTDLLTHVTGGIYAGLHKVNGVFCHHLAFTQDDLDWQIWIDSGKRPVPRKFIVTYKNDPGSPEVTTVFTDWEFSGEYPDHIFEFKAPKSARQINFLPLTKM